MIWGRSPRAQCEGGAWLARRNERNETMKARWLARAAFVLMFAAAAVLIGFAELASLAMVGIGVIGVCLMLGGTYEFLARRGVLRWLAAAVVIATPIVILVVFALHGLIWVALVSG